jgi:hypothetical protein
MDSFLLYYRRFFKEFGKQVWRSAWKELGSTVGVAAVAFILTRATDTSAKAAFVLTMKAAAIWLSLYAIYHLVRTPWKLDGEQKPASPQSIGDTVRTLATAILDFAFDRIKDAPSVSTPEMLTEDGRLWLQDMRQSDRERRALNAYEQDTLVQYGYKYRRAVAVQISSLQNIGLDTSALEEHMDKLATESDPIRTGGTPYIVSEQIKEIGKQLGILADQIKES